MLAILACVLCSAVPPMPLGGIEAPSSRVQAGFPTEGPQAGRGTQQVGVSTLRSELAAAGAETRDATLDELRDLLTESDLAMVLRYRERHLAERIGAYSEIKKIQRIADVRVALDQARTASLELIHDEVRYFAPYTVPEVSSERAVEYLKVQREVDRRVEAVREHWKHKLRVRLSPAILVDLEALHWTQARRSELRMERLMARRLRARRAAAGAGPVPDDVIPGDVPTWIRGLPLDGTPVSIRSFAWTVEQRDDLAQSREIEQDNAQRVRWLLEERSAVKAARRPTRSEAAQLQITNSYRAMLGLGVLAWNPALQEAAHLHSDYQDRIGEMTHTQRGQPLTKDVKLRGKAVGYDDVTGENIAGGGRSAPEVHEAWTQSSWHHRILVGASHTEMASGQSGAYWTQVFGRRPLVREELGVWRAAASGRRK